MEAGLGPFGFIFVNRSEEFEVEGIFDFITSSLE